MQHRSLAVILYRTVSLSSGFVGCEMQKVVILGTGGTIAGTASNPDQPWAYQAAQLSVAQLVAAVPALAGMLIEAQQVAQVDSKDMSWAVWLALGVALRTQLARADVAGVVITHGTDTLEETAFWLDTVLDGAKPVVLTAAMRPATSPEADGPVNLRDAVGVTFEAARRRLGGVVAVMHGRVWAGRDVRKAHSSALDAFDGGGASPLQVLDADGAWLATGSAWPQPGGAGWSCLNQAHMPRVEIVHNHVDADGWWVDAALAHADPARPLAGLVVACTGNGTVSDGLTAALRRAQSRGVVVWRASRVARGGVMSREADEWPACPGMTAAQARVALAMHLIALAAPEAA